MEENNNRPEEYGSDIKIKTPLLTKLENFWYHYKWHSLICLFIIFVVTICTVQMCSKASIDIHVMYAGNVEINRKSTDGTTPPYNKLLTALSKSAEDYDADGETVLSLSTLFYLTEEEIAEAEKDKTKEVNHTLLAEDARVLGEHMYVGEYYLCLLSPDVYELYRERDGVSLFMPIADYAPEDNSLEYYNEYAVKLSSTALWDNVSVRDTLPEDTLVVLRIKSAVSSAFGGKENDERFRRSEDMLRNILK